MPMTLDEILVKQLEQELQDREIAFTRKNGCLVLALFGNPAIHVYDAGASITLISGMAHGFHSTSVEQTLNFSVPHLAKPNTNPLDPILSVIDSLSAIMGDATNQDDVVDMRLAVVPTSTAKAAINRWFKTRGTTAKVTASGGSYSIEQDGLYWFSISGIYKNGKDELIGLAWEGDDLRRLPLSQILAAEIAK